IGTYTKNSSSEGIYVYEFDAASGEAVYKNQAAAVNPSYITINKKTVYTVNEADTIEGSGLSAFAYDQASGTLKLLSSVPAEGGAPCYVVTDKACRYAIAANYGGGNFSVFPILKNGALGK